MSELPVRAITEQSDRGEGAATCAGPRGRCTFMGLELEVGADAPEPPPHAELVARAAIRWLDARFAPADPWIADVCCGIGSVGCALAVALPSARLWACDADEGAIEAATANARRHRIEHRVEVRRGELLHALAGLALEGRIDAVVCSAPSPAGRRRSGSHRTDERAPIELQARLLAQAAPLLRPGGRVYLGLDADEQEPAVLALVRRSAAYEWLELERDAAGLPRVAVLRRTRGRPSARAPSRDARWGPGTAIPRPR